jgi:membrane dipeptidase
MHTCLPLGVMPPRDALAEHRAAGCAFVSVNAGMDFSATGDVEANLGVFRRWVDASGDELISVAAAESVDRSEGRLVVAFDLEGASPIPTDSLERWRALGLRSVALTYNDGNRFGSGCADAEDAGLTRAGRELVARLGEARLLVDCSHASEATAIAIAETATTPTIYSHSNPRALSGHFRNVSDEQLQACAATRGVVGVNGVNWFLGAEPTAERICDHVEYVGDLIGYDHVGLGLDHLIAHEPLDVIEKWPQLVPEGMPGYRAAPPSVIPHVGRELRRRGHGDDVVEAVLWGNFARVAAAVWGVPAPSGGVPPDHLDRDPA